jgi:hypothetical protein
MASLDGMTNEFKKIWEEAVVAYSKYYPIICLEELRNVTKNLGLGSRCTLRDASRARTEYKSRALSPDQAVQL